MGRLIEGQAASHGLHGFYLSDTHENMETESKGRRRRQTLKTSQWKGQSALTEGVMAYFKMLLCVSIVVCSITLTSIIKVN